MKFTDKHIECAKVCARLEISGQNTKEMALECGVALSTFYKWLKNEAFLAEKARCKAVFRVDFVRYSAHASRLSPRSRVLRTKKYDTRRRAIKQISDETAADVDRNGNWMISFGRSWHGGLQPAKPAG